MPGLFGMVHTHRAALEPSARGVLDAMAERLRHVGNETVDTWIDLERGVALARIDRAGAAQPPWPRPGHGAPPESTVPIWLLDGVVHSLGEGMDGASKPLQRPRAMRGYFSAVGLGLDEVLITTDRRASRPIAWTVVDEVLYFAPEIKALLAVPGLDRTLDDGAFGMFFASGFLLADRTFFRHVHRLEGGHALRIRTGRVEIAPWATWRFTVDGDGTSEEALRDELETIVRRSVARDLLGADGDPSRARVFLSGGKDSRMIAAAAARVAATAHLDDSSSRRLETLTWTAARGEPAPGSDVALARRVAARLGESYGSVAHRVVRRELDSVDARGRRSSFGAKGLRLTYLLDALVDIGMFHGDELRLMEDLARDGARRVLRGDQAFTRGRAMLDPSYAVLRMCIRSTSGLGGAQDVWRDEPHARACAAGDAWIDELVRGYDGVQEDNVGDAVYLRHRLQGYLGPAGYFKQLVVDHRNPLLDEDLLTLVQRLSIDARREQRLLNEAGAEAFSVVWDLPFATSSNLEDFADLLARPTPVRRAVRAALDDAASGVWEIFDRRALLERLDGLRAGTASGTARGVQRRLRETVKRVVRDAIYDVPALDVRVRGRYLRRVVREDELFLRVVALKHFIDLFVDDDGSSAAHERRRESLAAREAVVSESEGGDA